MRTHLRPGSIIHLRRCNFRHRREHHTGRWSHLLPAVEWQTGADNNWEERTGFASGGNIFESGGETAENAPEIRTTLTGLEPGAAYSIYVHFWDGSGSDPDWNIRAGFSSNPDANPLFANPGDAADIGATPGVLASTLTYDVPPTVFVEADRTMYAGLVGTAIANEAGEIAVYIDDLPSSIGPNNRTWYDGLSYWRVIDPLIGPTVITPATAPVGGSVEITASVTGTEPFSFQWLSNSVPIPGATNQTLILTNLQLADSGTSFSLVVSNNPSGSPSVATNAPATLTVRVPRDLVWLSTTSFEWNTNDLNWDTDNDNIADARYEDADSVRFDDRGFPLLTLASVFYPSLVVVSNEFNPYTLALGSIAGNTPLIKQGAAPLTLDLDNTYTGGTLIDGGGLQIGAGSDRGSVGSGPVTNNAGLMINRTGTLAIPGVISGTGGINIITAGGNNVANVILSGANTYSGQTEINGGTLTLANSAALGNSPILTVNSTTAGPSGGTRVTLSGGISIPETHTLVLNTVLDTARTMLFGTGTGSFTNVWNGPITVNGDGRAQFGSASGGTLVLNGNINAPNAASIMSRGTGANLIINGTVTLPPFGLVQTADGANIVINSTGNTWGTNLFANNGRWTLGADNALPVESVFIQQATDTGSFDLNGFNQQIAGLNAGSQIFVTNSSATSDSTLTLTGMSVFGGTLNEGTRRLHLTIASGIFVLTSPTALNLPGSTISIADGAVLQLDAAASHTVAALVTNGVSVPPGTYDAVNAAPFLAGAGSLIVAEPVAPAPVIAEVITSNGNLVFSGTNGPAGGAFSVLSTTNLAEPLPWPVFTSGTFDESGTFSVTNPIQSDEPVRFFILSVE